MSVGWPSRSLEVELPKRQRNFAPTPEVADVVKVAAQETGGAVWRYDGSYLRHAPNVGSMSGWALDLSTP